MPKGYRGCPYGGQPGLLNSLSSPVASPLRGIRIIPAMVWLENVYLEWRKYRAQALIGIAYPMPTLAPPNAIGVHFTDRPSLEGINDPAQCARRVALRLPDHDDCQRHGCVLIEFDIPDPSRVYVPTPTAGAALGKTTSGAHEWVYPDKIELSSVMDIIYLDPAENGPMYYYIPLD